MAPTGAPGRLRRPGPWGFAGSGSSKGPDCAALRVAVKIIENLMQFRLYFKRCDYTQY